ncbi:alpha/beta fold hydrolase [Mycobacterium sp. 155]|uniref:alpha/beta fold hydrolase n=1 Tax=Mycobacterium sp. 155 TaxID=1157943 RepID=UPI0003638049|nr:alpha/beta hydrolase [Mycobacterium sp. 155]
MRVDIRNREAVAADGTSLFVSESGSGEDILCIPGIGYASWSFHYQVEPLSQVARVLLMDNRGTGRSGKPAGPYSIAQMADDAYHVLRQCAAGPAHIVGTSMGGYIAMTLALRHPEAVSSLVLVATTSGGVGSHPVPLAIRNAWTSAASLGSEGFARATMPLSFAPGWVDAHPEQFNELLELRMQASTPVDCWRSQYQACASYLNRGLQRGPISQPAVIVHGTADRVLPYKNAAHLARRLPQASVVTLDGAGHLCWIEQPEVVNEIIRNTLGNNRL